MNKIIMVSGKYRANSEYELEQNIRAAETASIKLWQSGWIVICPHLNSARMGGSCDDSVWLNGYIEILRRCDAIFMLKKWHESEGAIKEHSEAIKLKIEVLYE